MKELLTELAVRLIIALVMWLLILGAVALSGHDIQWWVAALIALAVAFLGWELAVVVIAALFDR